MTSLVQGQARGSIQLNVAPNSIIIDIAVVSIRIGLLHLHVKVE